MRETIEIDAPFHLLRAKPKATSAFGQLPRPVIAVLVGGHCGALRWDKHVARQIGCALNVEAKRLNASLLVTTSYRTGNEETACLFGELNVPHVAHAWNNNVTANPLAAYLNAAERIWVTEDSLSMIAEAHATGKPVEVLRLETSGPINWLFRNFPGTSVYGREAYVRRLHKKGYFTWVGELSRKSSPAVDSEQTTAVDQIRSMIFQWFSRP